MGDGLTWIERMAADPGLRHFVDAEIARAGIALAAARANAAPWKSVAVRLHEQLKELGPTSERSRRTNQQRQLAHRRRYQFVAPLIEPPNSEEPR